MMRIWSGYWYFPEGRFYNDILTQENSPWEPEDHVLFEFLDAVEVMGIPQAQQTRDQEAKTNEQYPGLNAVRYQDWIVTDDTRCEFWWDVFSPITNFCLLCIESFQATELTRTRLSPALEHLHALLTAYQKKEFRKTVFLLERIPNRALAGALFDMLSDCVHAPFSYDGIWPHYEQLSYLIQLGAPLHHCLRAGFFYAYNKVFWLPFVPDYVASRAKNMGIWSVRFHYTNITAQDLFSPAEKPVLQFSTQLYFKLDVGS